MNIEAIQNHIVFEFIDRVTNAGEFEEAGTESGIALLSSTDASASQARWARVISAGPECCDDLKVKGCEILIENLKWTSGVIFNGSRVWRTDDSYVMVYRNPDGSTNTTFGD